MKRRMVLPSSQAVVTGLIGGFYAIFFLVRMLDSFSPKVEKGQDIATLLKIRGQPDEKYFEPEMVDGRYLEGNNVLVYRYKVPGPSAGDFLVYIKNGKVVSHSKD